jgi:hypothetical protein
MKYQRFASGRNLFRAMICTLRPALFGALPLWLVPSLSRAQDAPLSRYKSVIIRLGEEAKSVSSGYTGPFSHFEVIDARPDTLRIGIHADWYKVAGSRNRQLTLAAPTDQIVPPSTATAQTGLPSNTVTAAAIAGYLNSHFASPHGTSVALIVLRTLWLSDANYIREEKIKDPDRGDDKTKIRLKAEVYAVKDDIYIPLIRYDFHQTSTSASYKHFGKDLAAMLDDLADTAANLTARQLEHGRRLSLDDIMQFNQSRYEAAITKDGPLVKGVYNSFEEFKNNAPSIRDYEIKKEKKKSILYLKDGNGHSYYCHNAWGYCDGNAIYVMKDGTLEPAWREGKAWYFLSGTDNGGDAYSPYNNANYVPSTGQAGTVAGGATAGLSGVAVGALITPMINNANNRVKHVFTVDMDNGNVY